MHYEPPFTYSRKSSLRKLAASCFLSLLPAITVCLVGLFAFTLSARADDDPIALPPERLHNARDYLAMYSIDASQLDSLVDDEPLSPKERETLTSILFRIARMPAEDVHRWLLVAPTLETLRQQSEAQRIAIVPIRGTVEAIETERLIPELAEQLLFADFYQIRLRLADSEEVATIFARQIPGAWKEKSPVGEPVSTAGVFFKRGPDGLIFIAKRISWHPRTENASLGVTSDLIQLAKLGVDVGLLGEVEPNGKLESGDREIFYQMLAAMRQLPPDLPTLEAQVKLDLGPLLQQPEQQRGQMVTLLGDARRVVRVTVNDADIQSRFGIDHYYNIWLFVRLVRPIKFQGDGDAQTDTLSRYPILFSVAALPEGLAVGDNVSQPLELTGFFLKRWSYRSALLSQQGSRQQQPTPLFVGFEPRRLIPSPQASQWFGAAAGGTFIAVLGVIWFALWRVSRRDRAFGAAMLTRPADSDAIKGLADIEQADAEFPGSDL